MVLDRSSLNCLYFFKIQVHINKKPLSKLLRVLLSGFGIGAQILLFVYCFFGHIGNFVNTKGIDLSNL
jgi:hypothetical protein